jgi:hypothetical protein
MVVKKKGPKDPAKAKQQLERRLWQAAFIDSCVEVLQTTPRSLSLELGYGEGFASDVRKGRTALMLRHLIKLARLLNTRGIHESWVFETALQHVPEDGGV